MAWRAILASAALGGASIAGAAVACSSFASSPDQGTSVADDAAAEDAPATDATLDAGASAFCDRHDAARFCFSFDEGADPRIGAKLTLVANPNPGLTDAATSPPNALAVDVDNPTGVSPIDQGPTSGVQLVMAGAGTHAHCDLAMWVDQVEPDASAAKANVDVIFVKTKSGELFDYSVHLLEGSDALVAQTGISGPHEMIANVSRATWISIGFDLEVSNGKILVRGSADGVSSNSVPTKNDAGITSLGDVTLLFGESFVTGHWVVHLDDVVCDWN